MQKIILFVSKIKRKAGGEERRRKKERRKEKEGKKKERRKKKGLCGRHLERRATFTFEEYRMGCMEILPLLWSLKR